VTSIGVDYERSDASLSFEVRRDLCACDVVDAAGLSRTVLISDDHQNGKLICARGRLTA